MEGACEPWVGEGAPGGRELNQSRSLPALGVWLDLAIPVPSVRMVRVRQCGLRPDTQGTMERG